MNRTTLVAMLAATALAGPIPAIADHSEEGKEAAFADRHAPIGVMGDHLHARGEWMVSYRYMHMGMGGNLLGDQPISDDDIVTTIPNRFFGMPGQPPTLRIVPDTMDMDMHMVGMMYAPSDRVTLMAMLNWVEKDMDLTTYQGGMGTNVLGRFSTHTSGLADSSVSALIGLVDTPDNKVHAILGVSIPTGDLDETGQILTPMNMTPTVRLPYPMQLSSGTWDPVTGLSWSGWSGNGFGWGAQWRSTWRVEDNDEGYRLGDEHRLTGWGSYALSPAASVSLRLEYLDRGNVSGTDPLIMGPVQTADPDRLGGERLDLGLGLNLAGQGSLAGWRLAFEYLVPVEQDLDGPQMETDDTLTIGLQKSWD
ncbi:transporter [Marinihelvus fidelis]|uniref:Transporter n=1 Tax=Marinihelvus fidelis TaxID=2613842 RepID=A0A5N0TFB3_9GAMM|nr:transporter [Marinihelvus fidelis]KAA9132566.1 transporter [Marinihelvus fidelis]